MRPERQGPARRRARARIDTEKRGDGMKRTVLAALIALGAASCASRIRTDYYLIDTEPSPPRAAERLPLTVAVNNVRAPSRYLDQMNYRAPGLRAGFYEYSRWMEPPAEMVQRALCHALRQSGLFEKADPSNGAWNPDLVLQCTILAFDQVREKDGEYAECALAMELVQREKGNAVWSKELRVRVPQERRGGFAEAMSEAVAKTLAEAVGDMAESAELRKLAKDAPRAASVPPTAPLTPPTAP